MTDETEPETRHLATDRLAASIFNSYLLAHVVNACEIAGISDTLHRGALEIDTLELADRQRAVLQSAIAILQDHDLVTSNGRKITLTEIGRQVFRYSGFFTWAIGGYANYFQQLPLLFRDAPVTPWRDDESIARGAADVDAKLLRNEVRNILLELGVTCVVDLGCGDASRICDYVSHHPTATAIGIERSPAAAALALRRVHESRLDSRVQIIEGDCLAEMFRGTPNKEVDCAISFFMLHDLLSASDGNFQSVVDKLLRNFPKVDRFVLADTTCDSWREISTYPPVFVRGFEMVHAIMEIKLRTRSQYEVLLRTSTLQLERTIPLNVPNSFIFVLRV